MRASCAEAPLQEVRQRRGGQLKAGLEAEKCITQRRRAMPAAEFRAKERFHRRHKEHLLDPLQQIFLHRRGDPLVFSSHLTRIHYMKQQRECNSSRSLTEDILRKANS